VHVNDVEALYKEPMRQGAVEKGLRGECCSGPVGMPTASTQGRERGI